MIPRTGAPTMTSSTCQKRKRDCLSDLNSSIIKDVKRDCLSDLRRHHYVLGDWLNTGIDLLGGIHKKLPLSDTLTSRGVCSLWRSDSQSHAPPSPNSPLSPPPILWDQYHTGHDSWLLEAAAKRLLDYHTCAESSSSPPLPTPIQKALVLSDPISDNSRKRKRGCLSSPNSSSKRHFHRRRRHYFLRDWSNMGIDVLEDIQKKLPLSDTLTTRALCRLWRSVAQNHIPPSPNSPPPSPPPILWDQYHVGHDYWLLDAAAATDGGNLYLPNRETKRLLDCNTCVGFSSHGYLLFYDDEEEEESKLCLLHPAALSAFAVRMPPLPTGIQKALVLSDPIYDTSSSSRSYDFVVLDNDGKLMFSSRCGGAATSEFSQLECQDRKRRVRRTDMICINNCIYVINSHVWDHYMEAWDCSSNCATGPRKVMDFEPTFSSSDGHRLTGDFTLHLVESLGELLLVAIRRPDTETDVLHHGLPPNEIGRYRVCMVYRMDFREKRWVHMDSLGDRVLFIMEYQTMSLSAKEFPQYQRNSVYFRHYFAYNFKLRRNLGADRRIHTTLGIFNMEDGSLKNVKTTVPVVT